MLEFLVFGTLGATLAAEVCFLYKLIKKDKLEKKEFREFQKEIRELYEELDEIDMRLADLMNNKNTMSEEELDAYIEELIRKSDN